MSSLRGSAASDGSADVSCRTEDAGDSTTLLYSVIRLIFRATGFVFYATTECHGVEDFPAAGEPTLLCFNHGNGLADPLCLIKATPRMVRFCAKDTLWKVPIMGTLIRNSGAVPIYRQREHGDQAKDRNLEVFRTVIEVLRAGGCLGFAPEGVSRFLPYMEQPFKTGVARRGPAAANAARPWPATQPLRLALGSRAVSQPLPPPPLVQRAAVRALLSLAPPPRRSCLPPHCPFPLGGRSARACPVCLSAACRPSRPQDRARGGPTVY